MLYQQHNVILSVWSITNHVRQYIREMLSMPVILIERNSAIFIIFQVGFTFYLWQNVLRLIGMYTYISNTKCIPKNGIKLYSSPVINIDIIQPRYHYRQVVNDKTACRHILIIWSIGSSFRVKSIFPLFIFVTIMNFPNNKFNVTSNELALCKYFWYFSASRTYHKTHWLIAIRLIAVADSAYDSYHKLYFLCKNISSTKVSLVLGLTHWGRVSYICVSKINHHWSW